METGKKIIVSGMQPTGSLHLGNVLGATNNWESLLNDYDCLFFLANQHAITVPYSPADLRENTLGLLAQYIACGLDPDRCRIFLQSQIVGVAELMWVLTCITPIGHLERMTQFKDKSQKMGQSILAGLLLYPVLMAADILLYNADLVPTGEDQKQHLEIARDIAAKFNNTYSETFKIPEPYIKSAGARVMSLQNPIAKMSKSDSNSMALIFVTDDDDLISKKIMSAVTDSDSKVFFDEISKPGISNLLSIYAAASDISIKQAEQEFSGLTNYAPFKRKVADVIIEKLRPIRQKYNEICNEKDYLLEVLKSGAEVAQNRANKMISKVYRKVGFLQN